MSRLDRIVKRRIAGETSWDKVCFVKEWRLERETIAPDRVRYVRDVKGHLGAGKHRHGPSWWARRMADVVERRRLKAAADAKAAAALKRPTTPTRTEETVLEVA